MSSTSWMKELNQQHKQLTDQGYTREQATNYLAESVSANMNQASNAALQEQAYNAVSAQKQNEQNTWKATKADYETKKSTYEEKKNKWKNLSSTTSTSDREAAYQDMNRAYSAYKAAQTPYNIKAEEERLNNQNWLVRTAKAVGGGLADIGHGVAQTVVKAGQVGMNAISNVANMFDEKEAGVYQYMSDNAGKFASTHRMSQDEWNSMSVADQDFIKNQLGISTLTEFNSNLASADSKQYAKKESKESTAKTQAVFENAISPLNTYSQRMANEATYGTSGLGKLALEMIPSAVGMAFDAATGGITGGPLASMGLRVFGSSYADAKKQGSDDGRATLYALLDTAKEIGTELIGGEAVTNALVYKNKGLFNSAVDNLISRIPNRLLQGITLHGVGALEESLEEVAGTFLDPFVQAVLESDYGAAVREKFGEQRGMDYARAAAGAALLTVAGLPVGAITGTTSARLNEINTNSAIQNNPLLVNQYNSDVAKGINADTAKAKVTLRHQMGEDVYAEYSKQRSDDQNRAAIEAYAKADESVHFNNVAKGQVLLNENDDAIGKVVEANEHGFVVEMKDSNGKTIRQAVVKFGGRYGMLDSNSALANGILNQNWTIMDEGYARTAEERAETEAKATPSNTVPERTQQNQNVEYVVVPRADGSYEVRGSDGKTVGRFRGYGEATSFAKEANETGKVPERPAPKAQPTQQKQQPKAQPQQRQQAPQAEPSAQDEEFLNDMADADQRGEKVRPQSEEEQRQAKLQQLQDELNMLLNTGASQNMIENVRKQINELQGKPEMPKQNVLNNTQYKIDKDSNGKFIVRDADGTVMGGTYDTYADALGLVDQMSQTPSESPQNASQSASPEKGNSTSPQAQNSSETSNEKLNSKPAKKSAMAEHFEKNKRAKAFTTKIKGVPVKATKNHDGTFTVSIATVRKDGAGYTGEFTKVGIAQNTDEANQMALDAYNMSEIERLKRAGSKKIDEASYPSHPEEDLYDSDTLDRRFQEDFLDGTSGEATVTANEVQRAARGEIVDAAAAENNTPLTRDQVNDLSPVGVLQRLANYAKQFGVSLRGFIRGYTNTATDSEAEFDYDNSTERLVEENVMAASEDETDITGGEDDTRKERKRRSVEQEQAYATSVKVTQQNAKYSALQTIIRKAFKTSDFEHDTTKFADVVDQILDSRTGDNAPTNEQRQQFRAGIETLLKEAFKDVSGKNVNVDWSKLTTRSVYNLLGRAYRKEKSSGRAVQNPNQGYQVFGPQQDRQVYGPWEASQIPNDIKTELDALFERAAGITVFAGKEDTVGGLSTAQYTSTLEEVLAGSEWHENSAGKSQYFDYWDEGFQFDNESQYDNATDELTQEERDNLEKSWFERKGKKLSLEKWKERIFGSQWLLKKGTKTYEKALYNPKTGENINPNRYESYVDDQGVEWILGRAQGKLGNILHSKVGETLQSIYSRHQQKANALKSEIDRYQTYLNEHRSYFKAAQGKLPGDFKTQKQVRDHVKKLQERLVKEQALLDNFNNKEYIEKYNKDDRTTWNLNYTLQKAYNDKTLSQAERDSLIEAFKGSTTDYNGYQVRNLMNSVTEDAFKEMIAQAKEEYDARERKQVSRYNEDTGEYESRIGLLETESGRVPIRPDSRPGVRIPGTAEYDELIRQAGREPLSARQKISDRDTAGDVQTDTGGNGLLQSEQGESGQGTASNSGRAVDFDPNRTQQAHQKHQKLQQAEADKTNKAPTVKGFPIINEDGKTTRVTQARELGDGIFVEEESQNKGKDFATSGVTSVGDQRTSNTINSAFEELGVTVTGINGTIWHRHGAFSTLGGIFLNRTNGARTTRAYGFVEGGRVFLNNIFGSNKDSVVRTARHEAQHKINDRLFVGNNHDAQLVEFAKRIASEAGVDYNKLYNKISRGLATFRAEKALGIDIDGRVADEVLARIADGEGFGKTSILTSEESASIYRALVDSSEWQKAVGGRSNLRKMFSEGMSAISPSTAKVKTVAQASQETNQSLMQGEQQEQPITDIRFADSAPTGTDYSALDYQYRGEAKHGTTREGDVGLKPQGSEAQARATSGESLGYRFKEDFDSDNPSNPAATGNSQIGVVEDYGINNTMRNGDVDWGDTAPREAYLKRSEQQKLLDEMQNELQDMYQNDPNHNDTKAAEWWEDDSYVPNEDHHNSNWEKQYKGKLTGEQIFSYERETNPEDGPEAADEAKKANPWNRIKDANRRITRVSRGSALNNAEKMDRITGGNSGARNTVRNYQNLTKMIDNVMSGKANVVQMYHMLEDLRGSKGIGQIVDDRIVNLFHDVANYERAVYAAGGPESQTKLALTYKYAMANAMDALTNNIERVNSIEYDQKLKLIKNAEQYGKCGSNSAFVQARQWLNRMQMSGGNFWRMIDGYNRGADGIGYQWQKRHDAANATQIETQAKAFAHFAGLSKVDGFADFANGKAKGEYGSLLQEVSLYKMMNTVRREYRKYNPLTKERELKVDWSRVTNSKGFDIVDNKGKVVRHIEANEDLDSIFEILKNDIENNKAATVYMNAMDNMFGELAPELAKTSKNVLGYERTMYDFGKYFPVSYMEKGSNGYNYNMEEELGAGLAGFGNMKTRKQQVEKTYQVAPASMVVDQYIQQASNYVAYAEIGADLKLMLDGNGNTGSFMDVVGRQFGSTYGQWFKNYVKDMNGIKTEDPSGVNKWLARGRGLMQQGAIIGSVSIPIKQTASYFNAMGVVDPRAVAMAYKGPTRSGNAKRINNPFMQSRTQGSIDPEVSQFLRSDWVTKMRNKGGAAATLVNMTNIMDARTVANVYEAVLLDVQMNSGFTTSELIADAKSGQLTAMGEMLVNSKFEEAVLNTQPIFTKQARPELSRTSNEFIKMLSTFRTQQMQNYNRMLTSINEYRAAKTYGGDTVTTGANLRATMGGQIASAASLAALTCLADAVLHKLKKYKDDDGEIDPGKVLGRWGLNTVESLTGNVLFLGDLTKLAYDKVRGALDDNYTDQEFYGISMGAISSVRSVLNACSWLYSDIKDYGGRHVASNTRYVVNYISTLAGIPTQNAYAIVNSFVQWTAGIDGRGESEDILKEWDKARTDYGNRFYNYIVEGKTDKANAMMAKMGDSFLTKLKATGLQRLQSGESDDDDVFQMLTTYGGMFNEAAQDAISSMHYQIDTGSKLGSMKDDWMEGTITREEAIAYQQKYKGKTKAEAEKLIQEWERDRASQAVYGYSYSNLDDAYRSGYLSDSAYKAALQNIGGKTAEEAEATVNQQNFKEAFGESWSKAELARQYAAGNLNDSQYIKWYMLCEGATEDSAQYDLDTTKNEVRFGHTSAWSYQSDYNTAYASKNDKLGIDELYDQYGGYFRNEKSLGQVFNDFEDFKKTSKYGEMSYDYKGVKTDMSAEMVAKVKALNKNIANGNITYEAAKIIWNKKWGNSLYASGPFQYVKAA